MVHHQNMAGKAKRAQNQKPIPRGDGKVLADAQQIQPGHAQKDGQPYQPRRPSAPQHAQQGHQHDVERRDEPRLARTRAHGDAHLLKGTGQRQHGAAAHAAGQQRPALRGGHPPPGGILPGFSGLSVQRGDHRQHRQRGQRHAQTVKRKRTQAVRRYILSDERRAPDKRRKR